MANRRIDQLNPGTQVFDTDLMIVGNPSTGELSKVPRSLVVGNKIQALTDAATISWDFGNGNIATITLGGNRSLSLSNVPAGSFGYLKVKQDATGSRTLILPGNKQSGFSLSTGAAQEDILKFYYDGTTFYWTINNFGTVGSGADITPPTVVSATAINATTIRVIFSEAVTATNVGWSFKKNGSANNPTAVSGSGTTTLDFTVPSMTGSDTILRSYSSTTGDTLDASGNELVSFTDQAVTNSIGSGGVTLPTQAILILQAGQSNAVGRAPASAPDAITAPSDTFEFRPDTASLVQLADPTGMSGDYSQATVRSMNPNLGKRVRELTGIPVIILPVAKGNTGIDIWITTTNSEYTTMLSRWNALLSFCTANGITIVNKFAHWLQGENDAVSAMATDTYAGKLNTMVDFFTNAFSVEKVFVTRIGYGDSGTVAADFEKIMTAQKYLNYSKDSMIVSTFKPAGFIDGDTRISGNSVHYTLKGLNQVAEDVAQSIYNYKTNNKKSVLTEIVGAIVEPTFDDIYLFRSLKPGVNNTGYNEMFGRNNLTLGSGTTLSYSAQNGLIVGGTESTPLNPATVRELLPSHDWTIEVTCRIDGFADAMLITGRSSGNWQDDWLWFQSTGVSIKGNGVASGITPTGYNPYQLANYAFVWTTADSTLRTYINSSLAATTTGWSYTGLKLEALLRGYTTTPSKFFAGQLERIRIVKRALAVWEFDRSPNFNVIPAVDWDFQLNTSIAEAQGDISTSCRDFSTHAVTTPTYDADGVVFASNYYIRIGQQINLNKDFTIEFRAKCTTGSGTQIILNKGPRPQDGSPLFYWTGSPHAGITIAVGGTKNFTLPGGFDTTIFHTYKIVRDNTAGTVQLLIDGISINTLAATANVDCFVQNFGVCGSATTSSFAGTIDYMKIKNSL